MKRNIRKLLISLALPLAVGGLAALLTKDNILLFDCIAKPPLSPPGWLFPVVWTLLYLLMGLASYLVSTAEKPQRLKKTALALYGVQLAFNFAWPLIFFNLGSFLPALVCILLLWALIIATTVRFFDVAGSAGYLLLPYILWVTFAAYLNYGIFMLN